MNHAKHWLGNMSLLYPRMITCTRRSVMLSLHARSGRRTVQTRYVAWATFSTTSNKSSPNPELTLYQYAICPYCNIAKAVLNYTNTKFTIQEVNPLTKKELKNLPDPTYRKVPILLVTQSIGNNHTKEQINGSESIVDHIISTTPSSTISAISISNDGLDSTSPSSQKWTTYAREELAPLLYPNLCNTLANSYAAFGYVHGTNSPFSITQRYTIQFIGSIAMYMAASKVKKKRNITNERVALFAALQEFQDALVVQGSFLNPSSKDDPHLGDLAIYGVLRGLRGLPILDDIRGAFPSIDAWYQRMESRVDKS